MSAAGGLLPPASVGGLKSASNAACERVALRFRHVCQPDERVRVEDVAVRRRHIHITAEHEVGVAVCEPRGTSAEGVEERQLVLVVPLTDLAPVRDVHTHVANRRTASTRAFNELTFHVATRSVEGAGIIGDMAGRSASAASRRSRLASFFCAVANSFTAGNYPETATSTRPPSDARAIAARVSGA